MNRILPALSPRLRTAAVRPVAPDPERFLRDLDVTARARVDGLHNLPATGATEINTIEQEICDRCQNGIERLRQFAFVEVRSRAATVETFELTPADLDFDAPREEAGHAIVRARSRARDELVDLRRAEQAMLREMRVFQLENRLARSAHYPRSRMLSVGLLLVLIVLETAANAKLFADADPMGLVGGALQAFVVSLVNVLPSFAAGIWAWRNSHHVRPLRRLAGWAGIGAWLVVIGFFNLLVGHFRLALQADPDNAVGVVIDQVLADPMAITGNFSALVLVVAGAFSALLAAIDGYRGFDDRYPGYGSVARRHQRAAEAYAAGKARLRKAIEGAVDIATREIGSRLNKVHRKSMQTVRVINDGVVILDGAARDAERWSRIAEIGLRTYREKNARVRTTPAPAYFASYPVLNSDLEEMGGALRAKKASLFEAINAKTDEAKRLTGELHALAEREIESIAVFVLAVEREADAGTEAAGTAGGTRRPPELSGYLGQENAA